MGAYAYPIIIKREPQKVRYTRTVALDSHVLTVAKIASLVKENEYFSVTELENYSYELIISGDRLETQDELNYRVAKEEKYMAEYTKRKQNKY